MVYLGKKTANRIRHSKWMQATLVVGLILTVGAVASASDPDSLPGSDFEIDTDANLIVDHFVLLDWANVDDDRKFDEPTGKDDDSYAGGSKENDVCPGTTTGSIPNNKSDLLGFGVYVEDGDPGFLHLFWTRVNEPNGTTLMDFELNQSDVDCGNGINVERTQDDLLIEYRIEQGGAVATIKVRKWTGTEWGSATDLTVADQAVGTINESPIAAADSDGLIPEGEISPRTFGEASLDLDFIFDENSCKSFGSAFLKSRASDSFNSQLKDLIAPQPISITNCGTVTIRKQTDPDESPNTTEFAFAKNFTTDPSSGNDFNLIDDGVKTFTNVLFGTGLTVSEGTLPDGWIFTSIDCSASSNVTPNISGKTVTFAIDAPNDSLDCTFTNTERGKIIIEKQTLPDSDPADFTFTGDVAGTLSDGETAMADVAPGQYTSAETVPTGWVLTSIVCDDANSSGAANTATFNVEPGETVTCVFTNTKDGKIIIDKVTDPSESSKSFAFTGDLGGFSLTDTATPKDSGFITPGQDYDIAETVPTGWSLDSVSCVRTVTGAGDSAWDTDGTTVPNGVRVSLEPGDTVTCTFTNTRLLKVVVLVCWEDTDLLESSEIEDAQNNQFSTLGGGAIDEATQRLICGSGGVVADELSPGETGFSSIFDALWSIFLGGNFPVPE